MASGFWTPHTSLCLSQLGQISKWLEPARTGHRVPERPGQGTAGWDAPTISLVTQMVPSMRAQTVPRRLYPQVNFLVLSVSHSHLRCSFFAHCRLGTCTIGFAEPENNREIQAPSSFPCKTSAGNCGEFHQRHRRGWSSGCLQRGILGGGRHF